MGADIGLKTNLRAELHAQYALGVTGSRPLAGAEVDALAEVAAALEDSVRAALTPGAAVDAKAIESESNAGALEQAEPRVIDAGKRCGSETETSELQCRNPASISPPARNESAPSVVNGEP